MRTERQRPHFVAVRLHDIPPIPPHLGQYAAKLWADITNDMLAAKMLYAVDLAMLEAYCEAMGTYREMMDKCKADGFVVKGKSGSGVDMQHPSVHIALKFLEKAMKLATEFGLTPSARMRIGTGEKETEANPLDKLAAKMGKSKTA